MVRIGEVEHCVAKQNQQLFMLAHEPPRKGLIMQLNDDTFPEPLPELSLRGPKLLAVAANHQRRFLLLLLFFLRTHIFSLALNTLLSLRGPSVVVLGRSEVSHTENPCGKPLFGQCQVVNSGSARIVTPGYGERPALPGRY